LDLCQGVTVLLGMLILVQHPDADLIARSTLRRAPTA
jgi:hypothetical protein